MPDHGPSFVNYPPAQFALIPQSAPTHINAGGVNFLSSFDPATDITYASNTMRPDIEVLDGATGRPAVS